MHKPLMAVLKGQRQARPPIWMMRQAGRYLPEYMEVRRQAGSFMALCFDPEKAAEVTLQPIRRFGFDGAILFSDILVVPHALGQPVTFETGEGPVLEPIPDRTELRRLLPEVDHAVLEPVYETVRLVKAALPPEVTFLGFCGAPFTVATYMVAGRGEEERVSARLFAYRDPQGFQMLIDRLVDASIAYLNRQIDAGVDAVQLFDSWAGVLPPEEFERWCVEPMRRVVAGVKAKHPATPVIAFPRGAGIHVKRVAEVVGAEAVGIDWMTDRSFVAKEVQPLAAIQGDVDPLALLAGGEALDAAIDAALDAYGGGRHVFNLGHGIIKETPIAHVEAMIRRVRG